MTPSLTKRGRFYVAVYMLHGKRCRTSTRTSDPAEAAAALAVLASGGSLGARPNKGRGQATLLELVEAWANTRAMRGCTEEYARQCRQRVEKMLALMGWGDRARVLTPAAMEELRDRMLAKGASRGTVNSRMAYMGSFCSWLWKMGHLPAHPMVNIKALRHQPRKRRALTVAEIASLLKMSPAWARPVYLALFYSGLRVDKELATLTWAAWGDDDVLRFVGKQGVHRTVPVSAALRGVLEAQRAGRGMVLNPNARIFPRIPTSEEFNQHLAAAKIPKIDQRGHVASRHSLRHSWNQELTRAGVSSEQRKHLGGWADDTMPTGQYQDASALKLREAMDKIARIA
jgi:site-specific recombinase XerD